MNTVAEMIDGYEVSTDTRTVWINGPSGAVGRFGVNAIDVHNDKNNACIDCSKGSGGDEKLPETNIIDWYVFKRAILQHFELEIPDSFCPRRIRDMIGKFVLDPDKENPRWTLCREVLGREPKGWEFSLWIQERWRDFAKSLGWNGRSDKWGELPSDWAITELWMAKRMDLAAAQRAFNDWLFAAAKEGRFKKEDTRAR